MPRGIPNKQPTPLPTKPDQPTINAMPALIILQPAADGTRIDELRRVLLHLVARQAGVTIISEVVSRQARIVPAQRATPASPSSNGSKPSTGKARKLPIERLDDEYLDDSTRPTVGEILNRSHHAAV